MNNLVGVITSFGFVEIVLLLSKVLRFSAPERKRKFVHIVLGNWWLIPVLLIDAWPYALFPPFVFIFINLLALRTKDTALSSSPERGYTSYGTVWYSVSMCILVLLSYCVFRDVRIGGIGMIALAYGDGFAAVIGKRYPYGKFVIWKNTKSVSGCVGMAVITFILTCLYLKVTSLVLPVSVRILTAAVVSLAATGVEVLTPFGFDNLSVPVAAVLVFRFLT